MNLDAANLEALGREIAARLDEEALWDAKDCGAYFKRSARYFQARYASIKDFPEPIQLPTETGGKGQPLWPRREVIDWAMTHRPLQQARPGRPRRRLD